MDNPTPEPIPEPIETPAASSAPEPAETTSTDLLLALAHSAKAARLSPADEDRATSLLKERLAGGRAGITAAIDPMVDGLPWVVCVNAVAAVWEQLSVPMRRHLTSSVAKRETDPARRLSLSLARAVFKLDAKAGVKLAAAAAASLQAPETGAISSKYRQFFFNVFIGKGKPWLLQMPLGDLKASEADALVHAAFETLPICQPISQLSILRWVNEAGRLKKVSAGDLETAAKSISRWNGKLQRQLKADIPELPPALEVALKSEALKPETKPALTQAQPKKDKSTPAAKPTPEATQESAPQGEDVAPIAVPANSPAVPEELIIPGRAERLAKKAEDKAKAVPPQPERRKLEPQTESRENYSERERSKKSASPFDFKEALRGVEGYVAGLRSELEQVKAQLRRSDQEGKRGVRSSRAESAPLPAAELEALTRHNVRLEATVAELRAQLEDLASHHEAVAESRDLHSEEPLAEGTVEQLTKLLAIKLAERYETYQAMRLEPLDKVFRLDYRDLLGSVFDTLIEAGVRLKK